MQKYRVTPTRNGVKAPSIIVEVQRGKKEETEAIDLAKSQSGLSRFASWNFESESI